MSAKDDPRLKSGPLALTDREIAQATDFQAKIFVALLDQNETREKTNHVIFGKLDDAAALARVAVDTAEATKLTSEAAHAEVMGIKTQINEKFQELNGSIANTVARVKILEKKDGERSAVALQEAITSQAVKTVTTGIWMMPKPTWRQLMVMGSVIAFVGIDRLIAVIRTLVHLMDKI